MTTAAAAAAAVEPTLTFTDFQRRVLMTPEDHDLFLGGGRGGGKSFAIAILMLRHAEQYRERARMLFVRQSFPGVVDFEQTTRDVFGLVYGRGATYNAASHLWRFPNGGTLQLDQLENHNDFQKFQGKSFSLIATDEAGQYPDPAALDLLRSCLRAPKPIRPRFILAANPGGPGHAWITRRHVFAAAPWSPYVEAKSGRLFVNCPSLFTDNPHLDRAEYGAQLDAATATDPELGRAWRDGDWTVLRGAYFSAVLDGDRVLIEPWEPASVPRKAVREAANDPGAFLRRMIAIQNEGVRPTWDLFLAHDFGSSAPSVTFVCAESPGTTGPDGRYFPRGSILLLDELATHEPGSLERGMGYTIPILGERIKDLAKRWNMEPEGVADDAIFARTGSAAGSHAQEFARAGVTFTPARKGGRIPGWEVMRRMLQDAGKPDRPGLYVSRLCEYFWATVPTLPRDPRKPDDVDSRSADHAADACRYALNRAPAPTSRTIAAVGMY
jgi:hypothetical protein